MADSDTEIRKHLREKFIRSLHVKTVKIPLASAEEDLAVVSRPTSAPDLSDLEGLAEVEKILEILTTAGSLGQRRVASDVKEAEFEEKELHGYRERFVTKFSESAESQRVQNMPETEAVLTLEEYFRRVIDEFEAETGERIRAPRREFIRSLIDDVVGFGPISPLLRDPEISEIMVNGPRTIFIEKAGRLFMSGAKFFNEAHLMEVVQRIASRIGRQIDLAHPYVDARLPDGSRVQATIPPIAIDGTSVTIRKFKRASLQMEDLLQFGALTPEMAYLLGACVKARLNILVSGGTGTGKTTVLNVLSTLIPPEERLVTIEDAAELKILESHPHVVRLETRAASAGGGGAGEVSMRDLVRCSLRMRPNRVIVGECRGGEALDMLQAMNTGHDGSMTTAHANSAKEMLQRLETMCLMAGLDLPISAIRGQIASALDLVVHLRRYPDGSRKVSEIVEVQGLEGHDVKLRRLVWFDAKGRDENGMVVGEFLVDPEPPGFLYKFEAEGIRFPAEIFRGGTPPKPGEGDGIPTPPQTPIAGSAGGPSASAKAPDGYERIGFTCGVDAIPTAVNWVVGHLHRWGLSEDRVAAAELAAAEVMGNITRHAYKGASGERVGIEAWMKRGTGYLAFSDTGPPFDPTQVIPAERLGNEVHGMGIFLVRLAVDEMYYERVGPTNRLTLGFDPRKPLRVMSPPPQNEPAA